MRALTAALCAFTLAAAQHQDPTARLAGLLPADHGPGGVLLVARDGQVVFRRAFGLADVENNVPMPADAVMRIGSLTKQFTAVAILRLAEERKLSLGDDVRRYVPGLQTHGRVVTIEQLLAHTSGLPTMVDVDGFWRLARNDHDVGALLALTRDRPAHFEPGAGFRYNDSGYVALGAVIERVSGMPYAAFVESMVRPLGMRNTWYEDNVRVIPRRARGYSLRGSQVINAPYISMTVPHAAGALASTADDLLLWTNALKRGEVVSRTLLERAWKSRVLPGGEESGYGLGWVVCNMGGRATFEHGGWINGFTASAIALRDADITAIALLNRDAGHPSAPELAHRALRLVVTGSSDIVGIELDAPARRALTGTYRGSTPRNVWTIEDRNGALHLRTGQDDAEPLVAIAANALTPRSSAGTLVLHVSRESNGRVASFETRINCEKGERWTRVE